MAPQARGGLIVTVVGFFAGIWLFLAPFLVEYQKVGQNWIDATKNDLWTGGALMAITALTRILLAAFALRDAARAAELGDRPDSPR
jgi:divalent metal cation (Fe/Co/Zn/Cd) transporter